MGCLPRENACSWQNHNFGARSKNPLTAENRADIVAQIMNPYLFSVACVYIRTTTTNRRKAGRWRG
jgi:hypothetical protein